MSVLRYLHNQRSQWPKCKVRQTFYQGVSAGKSLTILGFIVFTLWAGLEAGQTYEQDRHTIIRPVLDIHIETACFRDYVLKYDVLFDKIVDDTLYLSICTDILITWL